MDSKDYHQSQVKLGMFCFFFFSSYISSQITFNNLSDLL